MERQQNESTRGAEDRSCDRRRGLAGPAAAQGGSSPGETLRGERLRRGLKLEEIAAATRIATHHIEALEKDRFDLLPGGSYRRSFLRQYARLLELDEQAILSSFQQQFQEPVPPLPNPPLQRRNRPAVLVWLPVTAAALAGIYGLWQVEVRAVPQRKASAPRTTVHAPSTGQADRVRQASPQLPDPHSAAPPDPDRGLHVRLSATEPVWILVKCDGVEIYSGMLGASAVRRFDADSRMTTLVGNAGGLRYSINGKTYEPTGIRGEVQMLEFTTAGPRVLTRRPPPAPSADETPQG